MTDSTDDVDQGYDGSDIPEEPKPIKKIKMLKIKPEEVLKDMNYSFKISIPLSDKKFSPWYTIEYGETRAIKTGIQIDKQRSALENDVEAEIYNSINILKGRLAKHPLNCLEDE